MKTFLRFFSAIAAIIQVFCACGNNNSAQISPDIIVEDQSFNNDWYFAIKDSIDEINPDLSDFEKVTLPHTPVIEPFTVNNQWQGNCYYVKKFNPNPQCKGKITSLKFDAAMNIATVWINGKKTVTHKGGYLPFYADFSPVEGENIVVVKLNNEDNSETGPKPLKQLDFCTFGGIYRNVTIRMKDSLHITDNEGTESKAGGIYFTTLNACKDSAVIAVSAQIENSYNHSQKIKLYFGLSDQFSQKIKYEKTFEKELKACQTETFSDTFTIKNPDLWSPDYPYLYELNIQLSKSNTPCYNSYAQVGIRKAELKKEGFYLNGEKIFLNGINRHQEFPYIGYAAEDCTQQEDAYTIKKYGFNYVRASHYPQSEAFLNACDQLGIMVLDPITGWQFFGDEKFEKHALEDCKYLIRRDKNHPCILAFELSINETQMTESFMKNAVEIARCEDPQALTAGWVKNKYNIYIEARQHRPAQAIYDMPFIVSEYGDWEYYAQNAGFNQDSWGDLKEEERTSRQSINSGEKRLIQQCKNIIEAHNDNLSTPAFADGYWVLYDYNRGYADDQEYSGIMSINRLPKFSAEFFRSQRPVINYENTPFETANMPDCSAMVFAATYWQPKVSQGVLIFSNCDNVKVYVDGKYKGEASKQTKIYPNLKFAPFYFDTECQNAGSIKTEGYINNVKVAEHEVFTAYEPEKVEVSHHGSFVRATIVDKNGHRVYDAQNEVTFKVKHGAEILGPQTVKAEAGIASIFVKNIKPDFEIEAILK